MSATSGSAVSDAGAFWFPSVPDSGAGAEGLADGLTLVGLCSPMSVGGAESESGTRMVDLLCAM